MDASFISLALIVSIVVALAYIMRLLGQPPIISYVLAGILASPYGLDLIGSHEDLELFSQMGVSFLLFMVGLSLSPAVAKEVGKVSLVTGAGQVIFTSLIGFGIAKLLGFDALPSLYIAVALTFSSTIIIMKLLSDKGDLETLYGRISVGFLIVQDLIAMLILIAVTSMAGGGTWQEILGITALKLLGLTALLAVAGLWIMPRLLKSVASSQELLLLFSIAWCLAMASFCQLMGLSMEIGALSAGITLSLSPYRFEVSSKLKPLRDFFIVLFFVLLGSQMTFENFQGQLAAIGIFSAFILLGNPLIVLILMGIMGYGRRTSFKAGLTVAQISEFSFILIALGIRVGHLTPDVLSLVTFVGLLTIAGSTYFILYADTLVRLLDKPLSFFERKHTKESPAASHGRQRDILLLGYERIGLNVLESLRKIDKSLAVVDYNPLTIQELTKRGVDCEYGDLLDADFLDELNFRSAKMIVSTLRSFDASTLIVRKVREVNKDAVVIVVSQQIDEALHLYELGASYVITPQFLSGYHTSLLIQEYGLDLEKFLAEKAKHLQHLAFSKKQVAEAQGKKAA